MREKGRKREEGKARSGEWREVRPKIFAVPAVFAAPSPDSATKKRRQRSRAPGARNCLLPSAFDCLQIASHSRLSRVRTPFRARTRTHIRLRLCVLVTGLKEGRLKREIAPNLRSRWDLRFLDRERFHRRAASGWIRVETLEP